MYLTASAENFVSGRMATSTFPLEAARHAASMQLFRPSRMFHSIMDISFLVERVPTSPLPFVDGSSPLYCDCDPPPPPVVAAS